MWNETNVKIAVELWVRGHTGKYIAEVLTATTGDTVTRNAVIGRLSRMNLIRSPKIVKPDAARVKAPVSLAKAPVVEAVRFLPVIPTTDTKRSNIQVEDLTYRTCHWPIGEVRAADFHYCGAQTREGSAYCAHHHKKVYRPAR